MSLSDFLSEAKHRELVEEVGLRLEAVRLVYNRDCRSWSEFVSVLKPPQWNLKHIEQRLTANLLHYRINYAVLCAAVYILHIVFHPLLLLALLAVIAFSFYTILIMRKPVLVGSIVINENGVKIGAVVISVLFLALVGSLEQLLWAVLYSLVLCLLHMLLRPRSVTSKTNLAFEQSSLRSLSGGFNWGGSGSAPGDRDKESKELSDMEGGGGGQSSASSSSGVETPLQGMLFPKNA